MKPENSEVTLLQSKVAEMEQTINLLQHQVTHQEVWLDGSEIKIKFKISDSTLYRYRKNHIIPYTKLGGRYLYPKSFFTKSLFKKIHNSDLM